MKTLILTFLMLPTLANATLCDNYDGDVNDAYHYVDSMFSALKILNESIIKVREGKNKDTAYNIITSFPKKKCVVQSLEPFTTSKNENIATSAKGISAGIERIIEIQKSQIELLKKVESGEITGETNVSVQLGESSNQLDDAWSTISLAVIGSTHALIDNDQLRKEEKLKALLITGKQKNDLKKKIERDFDTKKKKGTKIDVVATAYLQFLNDKWKTKK
ncbi:hypothetical protein [Bdellovibrio sp. HCB-162]|uniref:hypothetical protein n=1 Tax=Bdellovibrio sp. HCB-162 TaxID=3394234 RepID=UPI0039BC34C2